jgi:hypothetical protein
MSDFSGQPRKLFVWGGNNQFKLNSNPELNEAALQREQIRQQQAEWESNRHKGKVPDLIAQLLNALKK